MSRQIECTYCGDELLLQDNECQTANICDECFAYLESVQQEQDYEQASDADSGL